MNPSLPQHPQVAVERVSAARSPHRSPPHWPGPAGGTFTLTYLSRLEASADRAALNDIVSTSKARNAKLGITGLLLVRGSRVMQILEGDERRVRSLFARIRVDQRHHDVIPVWMNAASGRRFPNWSMGFEDLDRPLGVPDHIVQGSDPSDSFLQTGLASSTAEQLKFLSQRQDLLRRALVAEDRLIATLALIMYAHDPHEVCAEGGEAHVQCRECPPSSSLRSNSYPCPTAQNAFWALVASS